MTLRLWPKNRALHTIMFWTCARLLFLPFRRIPVKMVFCQNHVFCAVFTLGREKLSTKLRKREVMTWQLGACVREGIVTKLPAWHRQGPHIVVDVHKHQNLTFPRESCCVCQKRSRTCMGVRLSPWRNLFINHARRQGACAEPLTMAKEHGMARAKNICSITHLPHQN